MLLLIFFLLSSQFVIQSGVKVKAAQVQEQMNKQTYQSSLLHLTAAGAIYVGTEQTGIDALAKSLFS